ncbi:MAG: hypothetical protein ACSLE6_18155 [Mycobacterium sp.]
MGSSTAAAIAAVDALVAAVEPGIGPPAVEIKEVVLVTGPWLAGTSSLVGALRTRLPEVSFVESEEIGIREAPSAVVFVTSAVAPLTASDCALLDSAAANTDPVIGVVTKIDVHRKWREVVDANRSLLARCSPQFADVEWVGVAAAPEIGDSDVDALLNLLADTLAAPDLARRNRLRAWEFRLQGVATRLDREAEGVDRQARVATLRKQRSEAIRHGRLSRSERTIAMRSQIQQARVQLAYFARNRCASVRSELQEDAAAMTRSRLPAFADYAHRRLDEVVGEVEDGITAHLSDVAHELALPPPPSSQPRPRLDVAAPPLTSRRLETRLMMLLGAGFGLGIALTLSRLFADLAPAYTIAGTLAGGITGLAVTVWIVGVRGLLHDRAVLDRWITEITSNLRATVEELAATRVLAAESALTAQRAAHDETDNEQVERRIAEIDAELREHSVTVARAAARRDRRAATLQRALDAVHAELAAVDSSRQEADGDVAADDEVSVPVGAEQVPVSDGEEADRVG